MQGLNLDFSIYDIFPDLDPLVVVDVGALPLNDNQEIYASLLEKNKIKLIAFEANESGCAKLEAKLDSPHEILPMIIGDGKPATFHENKYVMTSSLLPTNVELVSGFSDLHELMETIDKKEVETHALDDVVSTKEIDFLKMDVQGGELKVLDGAQRIASSALAVLTEVEFVPLYMGQPLFADIDIRLRELGFQFHMFDGFGSRCYKPLKATGLTTGGLNQMLWSDATYVTDPLKLKHLTDTRLLKLTAILHDMYKSIDLALYALKVMDDRGNPEPLQVYAQQLGLG